MSCRHGLGRGRITRAAAALLLGAIAATSLAACGEVQDHKRRTGGDQRRSASKFSPSRTGTDKHAKHKHDDSRDKPKDSVPSGKLVVSRCDYHSPASSACGSVPPADSCSLRDKGLLQDPGCTPGAIDPHVTQRNLGSTICRSGGYTDSVRPPTSYTTPLEFRLIRSYDLTISPDRSELDHLVSLELGGAPSDPRNLFPEPYTRGAYTKDTVENQLHEAVCDGRMSLAKAQLAIVDWVDQLPAGALPKNPPPLGGAAKSPGSGESPAGAAPSSSPSTAQGGAASGSSSGKCDRNYSGACLDPTASDYDCKGGDGDGPKYVQGPIRITGDDHFGLSGGDDKIACE